MSKKKNFMSNIPINSVAYARGGGGGGGLGVKTPSIEDYKKNENLSFWNEPPFFIQRLPKLLSCFSVLSNLFIKSCKTFIVMQ